MNEHEDLRCAFDKELPCPNECGLHNFQLRMRERYSISPGVVSELIVNCPPRHEGGLPGIQIEENGGSLKQYCLHFKSK